MSGGELMAVQAVASLGSKLFGAGGAQAAPAGAPVPGPFDAITGGQPQGGEAAPPMPGRNSLFAGAQLTPDKGAPVPTKNPLFHSAPAAAEAAGMMAMPTRNPLFHDEAGGLAESARGMFSPKPEPNIMDELADPPLPPYSSHMKTAAARPTVDNNQRARDQGWDVETIYGTELNKGGEGAPYGDLNEVPKNRAGVTEAAKPKPRVLPPVDVDSSAPVQAATTRGAPRLDEPAFDASPAAKPGAGGAQGGLFGVTIPYVGELNEKLRTSPTNPLFQVGMGLLSSGYDGSNPFTQMNAGMGRIPGLELAANQDRRAQTKADEDAAEAEELRQIMALLSGKPAAKEDDEDEPRSRVARQAAKVVR